MLAVQLTKLLQQVLGKQSVAVNFSMSIHYGKSMWTLRIAVAASLNFEQQIIYSIWKRSFVMKSSVVHNWIWNIGLMPEATTNRFILLKVVAQTFPPVVHCFYRRLPIIFFWRQLWCPFWLLLLLFTSLILSRPILFPFIFVQLSNK